MLRHQQIFDGTYPGLTAPTRRGWLRTVVDVAHHKRQWGFPEVFVVCQAVLPALLYIPGVQSLRVLVRMAPFAISLIALGGYAKQQVRGRSGPATQKWLVIALAYLTLMIFHPTTNSLLAGIAQVMLYLSVMAPMFWASKLQYSSEQVQRLLFIMLICSGVNSLVGVLQVYDPATWMPSDFSAVAKAQEGYLDSLSYRLASGETVVRPPGLSDLPGAVCGPATVATVLGLIFCFAPLQIWKRAVAFICAMLGLAALFLSLVRTSLLIACGALLVYITLLALQKQKRKAVLLLVGATSALVWALSLALALGGESVSDRFATLFEGDPMTVYYKAGRGDQIQYGLTNLLFDYPEGAGLGRWGMMRYYFGDPGNSNSPLIWAELQPNAWILDGGVVLLLCYPLALIYITRDQVRIARFARAPDLRFFAATILSINAATLALIFGYTPFTAQIGLQYWFLCGVLYSFAHQPASSVSV